MGSFWIRLAFLSVALFLLGIWVYPVLFRGGRATPPREPLLHKPAIPFELERLDQTGKITLKEFSGRILLLNFWASWCDACHEEARELNRIQEGLGAEVVILGVGIQDTRENLEEFARRYNFRFPLARDPEGELAVSYGVTGIPETFLIDGTGVIRYRWRGPISFEMVHKEIEEALRGS